MNNELCDQIETLQKELTASHAREAALIAALNLASGQALALREALNALLSIQGTVEVLGEWEALDINPNYRKRDRAKVEAINAQCRAALTADPPPVVPKAVADGLAVALGNCLPNCPKCDGKGSYYSRTLDGEGEQVRCRPCAAAREALAKYKEGAK